MSLSVFILLYEASEASEMGWIYITVYTSHIRIVKKKVIKEKEKSASEASYSEYACN